MIALDALDLAAAAVLVLIVGVLGLVLRLEITRSLLIAAARTMVQLLLVGLVLRALFANVALAWVLAIGVVMVFLAGREVMARQKRRLAGWWGFGVGTGSMFLSSFTLTVFALIVMIGPDPWFAPQYAVPLLGMLLGNTMNGISIGMDRFSDTAWQQRAVLEQRLLLGQPRDVAVHDVLRDSIRSGMIPIINSMAAAGIISLPGMMTGQILAGSSPVEAVKYQIMIMFMISTGTGLGVIAALRWTAHRLFDDRHRLRLDRLRSKHPWIDAGTRHQHPLK